MALAQNVLFFSLPVGDSDVTVAHVHTCIKSQAETESRFLYLAEAKQHSHVHACMRISL